MKLKFRTAKRTFDRDKLAEELALKPLNDIPEIEAYGHGPRVKCKNLRGPFQEVQIAAHSWEEIDTPAFWSVPRHRPSRASASSPSASARAPKT